MTGIGRRLVVACALVVAMWGNGEAADAIRPLAGYTITSWTDVDGRPFGAVYAIVQDADRFLWVASNAGLLRFDGTRFATWDAIAETPLPRVPVASLCLRADGSLWVGLADGAGIYRVAGRRADQQDAQHQLAGAVTAIVEDGERTLWAVADSQLYRLDHARWEPVPLSDPAPGPLRITSVARRQNGELLVTTTLGLFGRDHDGTFRKIAPGWAWAVDEDARGAIWVTDTVTGFRRTDERRRPRAGFGRNGYRLLHDETGALWLASIGEGLLRITADGSQGTVVERATLHTGSLTDSVQSLAKDSEGNVWAGSTIGLHKLTRQKLMSMPNVGLVTTAAATENGDIWTGTNYGIVRFVWSGGRWQPQRLRGPTVYVTNLLPQPDGTVWIGAREGVLRLNGDRFAFVAVPPAFGNAVVRSLADDGHDGLWIGDGQNLFHWDQSGFERFERPTAGDARVSFASRDRNGRLWMAFQDGSVGVLAEDRSFREFPRERFGSGAVRIHSIVEGADGRTMWFGTSNGISRLRDGRILTLGGDSLPSRAVWTITQDARGDLWADLDWGVIRFAADDFEAAAITGRLFEYDFYDSDDGLSGAPVTNMRSGRTGTGMLWFVRGGALTTIDPVSLDRFPVYPPAPIRIEAAADGGALLDAAANMTLPAGLHRLDISYTAVALTHPNRIRFRYHLDGFDTSWTEAGTRRAVSYTNLPPRTYTFRVEAETNAGAWHAAAPWTFSIAPKLYQTWWFEAACGLAVVLGAWGAWRVRLRLERQRHAIVLAERARLSREIHDTLLQGMVGMTLRLEHLAQDAHVASTGLNEPILAVRRRLEHYIRDARRSIRNLRAPVLEIHDLAEALREIGSRETADSAIAFALTTVGHVRRYAAHIENEVLRIAQEAITNAVRHSRATKVHVVIGFAADRLTLEIEDDGCGVGTDAGGERGTHFGIVTMRERAESLGGRFSVGNLGTGGTRVHAVIPS